MIHVKRGKRPKSLLSDRTDPEFMRAESYFRRPTSSRRQSRFVFDPEYWVQADVLDALDHMFHRKCAFCESPVPREPHRSIHHMRPRSNTRDPFQDRVDPDRYWWLAYEWENLYSICDICSKHKGDQFPVAAPTRADFPMKGAALLAERPLLLDPCVDDPAGFLHFREDGRVYSLDGNDPSSSRGEATIFVFGLNREDLIHARERLGQNLRPLISELFGGSVRAKGRTERLQALFDETLPYEAYRRSLIMTEAWKHGASAVGIVRSFLTLLGRDEIWPLRYAEFHEALADKPARKRRVRVPFVLKNSFVTEVTLINFRSIGELTLTVDHAAKAQEQVQAGEEPTASIAATATSEREWTVLVGENGTGKSSVLQAICLALAGEKEAKRFFDPESTLRRAPAGELQAERGSLTVKLTGETIRLTFDRIGFRFESGGGGSGTFLRAYGSTRLLPRPKSRSTPERRPVRVDNLFDPFTPLHHADRWIARLWKVVQDTGVKAAEAEAGLSASRQGSPPLKTAAARKRYGLRQARHDEAVKRFDAVGRALKDLLRLPESSRIECRDGGNVVLKQGEVELPIRQLSDGYQTVIALAVDIMAGIPTREADFKNTPGIVLLDELGTHLHPRWRMEIVASLRRAFSGMQFIATTHEPLCLRGLRKGEIVVMHSEEGNVTATTDLPSPEGLRVDQLLTSPIFGLHTTIDPELDGKFQRYYELLAKPELADGEPDERDRLRAELRNYSFLGYTRRDQLVLDVIDRFLAEKRKEKAPVTELPQSVRDEVLSIWNNVGRITGVEV